jgi:hypothetical protein
VAPFDENLFSYRILKLRFSQAYVDGDLYIRNHCLYRPPLYSKSLSIKGASI